MWLNNDLWEMARTLGLCCKPNISGRLQGWHDSFHNTKQYYRDCLRLNLKSFHLTLPLYVSLAEAQWIFLYWVCFVSFFQVQFPLMKPSPLSWIATTTKVATHKSLNTVSMNFLLAGISYCVNYWIQNLVLFLKKFSINLNLRLFGHSRLAGKSCKHNYATYSVIWITCQHFQQIKS